MLKSLAIGAGHAATGHGACGAVGYISESDEARRVRNVVHFFGAQKGVRIVDCTCDSGTQSQVLNTAISIANEGECELAVQVHFNACKMEDNDGFQKGCECWIYPGSKAKPYAEKICKALGEMGYRNRGVKESTTLKFLRKTNAPAIIIEVCFVDDKDDTDFYKSHFADLGAGMAISAALFD